MCEQKNRKTEKIEKLQTLNLNYFLGRYFFDDDGFQNMFVYQPIFNTFDLKKDKGTEYVIGWESKGSLVGNQKGHKLLNSYHHILLSCIK